MSVSGDNSVMPGVQFQAELRLPFNTLDSLPASVKISKLFKFEQYRLLSKHFKGSIQQLYKKKKIFSQLLLVVMQILVFFAMVLTFSETLFLM